MGANSDNRTTLLFTVDIIILKFPEVNNKELI